MRWCPILPLTGFGQRSPGCLSDAGGCAVEKGGAVAGARLRVKEQRKGTLFLALYSLPTAPAAAQKTDLPLYAIKKRSATSIQRPIA